jgi:Trypsin-co-occurring domain 2
MSRRSRFPLADFLAALRGELKAARAERDPDLPLEVGPVTVEFTVLTRQEGEGKAGIRFWVADAGVSGKLTGEATQKVTLQLTARASDARCLRRSAGRHCRWPVTGLIPNSSCVGRIERDVGGRQVGDPEASSFRTSTR